MMYKLKAGTGWPTAEWHTKEYGSWEDAGCPESGHVYNVIGKLVNRAGKTVELTREEIDLLSDSLRFQFHWDGWRWDEPLARVTYERSMKAYQNKIQKLKTQ